MPELKDNLRTIDVPPWGENKAKYSFYSYFMPRPKFTGSCKRALIPVVGSLPAS